MPLVLYACFQVAYVEIKGNFYISRLQNQERENKRKKRGRKKEQRERDRQTDRQTDRQRQMWCSIKKTKFKHMCKLLLFFWLFRLNICVQMNNHK